MNNFPYYTITGDTFDSIALDFFDEEKYASDIIQLNPKHSGTIRFDANIELKIPYNIENTADTQPPWKR